MRTSFCLLIFVLVLSLTGCVPASPVAVNQSEPEYWPTAGWQSSTPEAQGMVSTLLAGMLEEIAENQTNLYSVMIIRNGYVVTEAYFHPYTRETAVHVQSITKSVIGILVGRAMETGAIKSVDESMLSYFPGVQPANGSKAGIHLSHLLSMSSGLDCQEFSAGKPKMEQSEDWVQFMLELPAASAPGKKFGYCNGNAHLLSAVLRQSTGVPAREYANQELFAPLGIAPVSEADWASDPQGYSTGGYGLHLRPADLAKLAFLFLHNGRWEDRQILPADWAAKSTTQMISKEDGSGYGYLWTVYPRQGRYAALGLGGQQIHVYPAKNLIVVVTGGLPAYAEAPDVEKMLSDSILPAIQSDSALPENTAGADRLQAIVEAVANPVQAVGQLPAAAQEVSGKVYSFDENPTGWQTVQFDFVPGAATASLSFNDSAPLEIGLDNVYRRSEAPGIGTLLLRGRWLDEQTFTVDYPYSITGPLRLGELGETEIQFQFAGDTLKVTCVPQIFEGEPVVLRGNR